MSIGSRKQMLIHEDWPEYSSLEFQNAVADREIDWVISLIEQIRSVRSELRVPAGAKIPLLQVKVESKFEEIIKRNKILIEKLARLSSILVIDLAPKGAVTIAVEGSEFALRISDFIDLPSEAIRLTKSIEKIKDESVMLTGKLSNTKFIANAPEAVIIDTKERLLELNDDLGKLAAALRRITQAG